MGDKLAWVTWIWDSGPVRSLPLMPPVLVAAGICHILLHPRAALTAAALTLAVTSPNLFSLHMMAAWTLLALVAFVSPWQRHSLWGVAPLVALAFVAVPGSILWGDDTASASLSHAVWVAPFAVLAFIRHDDMTLRYFMVPTALHALAVAFDGLTGDIRATGLVSSPTAAGGWLAFGVAYLAYHRWGLWPALLLVAALTLTESRLAMLAVLVVVCGLAAAGRVRWRVALPMCIAALTLAVVVSGSYSPKVVITNLENRLEMPRAPSLLPGGYFTERDMATSVPLRLSLELGYVGALLWLVLSGVALRGRRDVSWWALVALLLLSTLDVYTWVGSLAPLWWALLGMRLNGATTALSPAAALVSASSPAQGRGSLHATPSMPTLSPQAQSQRLHRQ